MLIYEEKFPTYGRMNPIQADRLLKQGDLNRKVIKPNSLRLAVLSDLRVGVPLFHYTNCGNLWSHIIRSRDEEVRGTKGDAEYLAYKTYIKEGVERGVYYVLDERKTADVRRTPNSKQRAGKSPN